LIDRKDQHGININDDNYNISSFPPWTPSTKQT